MKRLIKIMSIAFATMVFCACEGKLTNDNVSNETEVNESLSSAVKALEEKVMKLSAEIDILRNDNEILRHTIDSLNNIPMEDNSGVFEVDGLYFGRNGQIISPLKKESYSSGNYDDPSVCEYQYDQFGRIKSVKYSTKSSNGYEETFTYEKKKLTRQHTYGRKYYKSIFEYE